LSSSNWQNAIPNAFSSTGQSFGHQHPGGSLLSNTGATDPQTYVRVEDQRVTELQQPTVHTQFNGTGQAQSVSPPIGFSYTQQRTPQTGRESNIYASTNLAGTTSTSSYQNHQQTTTQDGLKVVTQNSSEYRTQQTTHGQPNSNIIPVPVAAAPSQPATITSSTYKNGQPPVASLTGTEVRTSMRVGEGRVVSERIGESRIVSERVGEKRVIASHNLDSRIVEERTVQGASKVVSEVEGKRTRVSERREVHVTEQEVEIVKRDKVFEIVTERPVRVERIVDVNVDVMVDVPIERTIERERITNIVREIPIEKIVEIPIEQIYEVPVEKIIEQPVEIQRFVEVPVERVVQKPYDVIRENVTYQDRFVDIDERDLGKYPQFDRIQTQVNYQDQEKVIENRVMVENLVEKIVPVERQKIIEVPREKLVENRHQVFVDRPRTVEKRIPRDVEVQIERPVYKDVPVRVERPVYRENLIEVPVPVERVVEREVQVPVDRVREKKVLIERVIENPVEHIVEIPVPYEQVVEEVIEEIVEAPFEIQRAQIRPQEKIIRRSAVSVKQVQVPVEYAIDKLVSKPVTNTIEKKVNKYSEKRYETPFERPVYIERVVEVPKIVERIIEVPVEVIREQIRFVEKIIERPVYIDTVIDKFVEVIVEKIVEVPVEKIVEVEVEIITEVPQIEEVDVLEDVMVEGLTETYTEEPVVESNVDFEDELLTEQIKLRQLEMDSLVRKNRDLLAELGQTQREIDRMSALLSTDDEREHFSLLSKFAELNSRYRMEVEHGHAVRQQRSRAVKAVESVVQRNPHVEELKRRLEALVAHNQELCQRVQTLSDNHLKRVRYSQFRA